MNATILPPQPADTAPAPPETVHSCPSCSHWLPEGTLACPDCATLAYGPYLAQLAAQAQALEDQQKWAEARAIWVAALAWLPEDTRQTAGVAQRIAALDERARSADARKATWTRRLGPLAPFVFFLLKAKSALFLLFKLKFFFSLFAFFGLYWALFGWQFALGFTGSIFIHEMGHYIAAKRRGMKVDLPMFLPGFGAYVRWYNLGVSRADLASISLAGPLYGLASAIAFYGLAIGTHAPLFLVLANVVAWINLLNLVPILGLDGAKAIFALSRLQRALIGITAVIFFALTSARDPMDFGNPSNHYIFLVIAAGMGWRCFTRDQTDEPHTGTLTYFLAVLIVLGLVLHMSGLTLAQIPALNGSMAIH